MVQNLTPALNIYTLINTTNIPRPSTTDPRKFCSLTRAQTHKHSRVHPQKMWVATCCTPNPSPLAAVQLGGLLPLAQLEVVVPAGRLLAASHQLLTIYLQYFCPLHKYSCCFYASLQAHSFLQVFQLPISAADVCNPL